MTPHFADEAARQFEQARALELSDLDAAKASYLAHLLKWPEYPNTAFRLGLLLQEQSPQAAIGYYQAELNLRPLFWACRNNLALLLQAEGEIELASKHFERALHDCPDPTSQAQLWENLGDLWVAAEQQSHALQAYQAASDLNPQIARLYWKTAQVFRKQGELFPALQSLQRLTYLQPQRASVWMALAELQLAGLQYNHALNSLEKAFELEQSPRLKALICLQLAHCQAEAGRIPEAQNALQRGFKCQALDGLRLAQLSLLPPIYSSFAELQATRQAWEVALSQLAKLKIDNPVAEVGSLPFYLPYQGFNDLPAMTRLSQIYSEFLPVDQGLPIASQSNRLRVACVSHFLHNHSLTQCFGGFIEFLPRDQFEVGFFDLDSLLEDDVTRRLQQRADYWSRLPSSLSAQIATIRAWQPDIVLYTDLGTHLPTWLLGHYRLAPVQWVFPGHPVTSGLPQIDGFLSNHGLDSPEADTHYRENLIRLDYVPTYVAKPKLPETIYPRSHWGLAEDKNIYLCPVSLFKIHPLMDTIFAEILAQDAQAQILCLDRPQSELDQLLRARFQRHMGALAERIWFLPWLKPADFIQLLFNADVYLETFPFGSGTTLYTAFATGIPVVAIEAEFARGRFASALYKQMGLSDLIAQDNADYLAKALSWAQNKALNRHLGERIRQANFQIYQYPPILDAFQKAILKAHTEAGGRAI
jgi:protein O-GlcNAc transferase